MARILIVGDDPGARARLAGLLSRQGYEVEAAESPAAAVTRIRSRRPDLALVDLARTTAAGIEWVKRLRRETPSLPVVAVAREADVAGAVAAMKAGATDVFRAPLDADPPAAASIDAILAACRGTSASFRVPAIGASPRFDEATQLAIRFALPEINVLLVGETGTGKDLFARMIHGASKRSAGPFVPVDCSVLPIELIESELFGHEKGAFTGATMSRTGWFETAQGGTLFLDEVGNLPPPVQAKLLRVLQDRRFSRVGGQESIRLDVRLISATNSDIAGAIDRGAFRQDLYYRLNEVTIHLPPLRERRGDVALLARHFVGLVGARLGRPARDISPEALAILDAYSWPGNVRELENAVKAAVVLADDVVRPEHLPLAVRGGGSGAAGFSAPSSPERPEGPAAARSPHGPQTRPPPRSVRLEIDLDVPEGGAPLKSVAARAAEQAERAVLAELLARGVRSVASLARAVRVDEKTLRDRLRRYGLGLRRS